MPSWYLLGAAWTGMGGNWFYPKAFGRTCLRARLSSSMTDGCLQERCGQICKSARWTRIREFRSTEHPWIRFLHGCCLVASALDRKLFFVADIEDVGYWVAKIQSEIVVHPFVVAYGYQENIEKLIRWYRTKQSPYKNWVVPYQSWVRSQQEQERLPRARQCVERRQTTV